MQWSMISTITDAIHRSLAARFRSVPGDVVKDAVMEAQCRFCRKFYCAGKPELPVHPHVARKWISTTAIRILLYEHRRQSLIVPWPDAHGLEKYSDSTGAQPITEPGITVDGEELQVAHLTVNALMDFLTPALARVVHLHDIEGIPLDEIAGALGCTPASIRKRHSRALCLLRNICRSDDERACRCGANAGEIHGYCTEGETE